ncbi:MAG: thiosulfate oxidation carrier protein SoxY [Pseudomonadota bacterium]
MTAKPILTRRRLLELGAGTVFITASPIKSYAAQSDLDQARHTLFGERPIQDGRVTLKLPPIAENGHSVPLSVDIDSPMTETDYVKRVAILSPRNPLSLIAQYHFTPQSGSAYAAGRIRLAGTQTLEAIAEMSDGTLWSGRMETVVTLAACVVL